MADKIKPLSRENLLRTGNVFRHATGNKDYARMVEQWGVSVEEAITPAQKDEAYNVRVNGFPTYALDEKHPDNARIGMKITKSGPDAGMHDELDDSGRAHVFLIKQLGKTIGTFRLVVAPENGRDMLIDRLFPKEMIGSVDESKAVEMSYMAMKAPKPGMPPLGLVADNGLMRTKVQFEEVLALAVTKKIVEFAHEHGKDRFVSPAPEWKAMPFQKIGITAPMLPGLVKQKPVGDKVDLHIYDGTLREIIQGASPEVKAIIDPEGHFHTRQQQGAAR